MVTAPSLLVVSGPSGVGKTSLVQELLKESPDIICPVSYTTRAPRPGETDGENYHFVDESHFSRMVAAGEFLEHANVFGNQYGTASNSVRSALEHGKTVLLEIDWQGAAQARELFPSVCTVMIMPPSINNLRDRLNGRQQDNQEIIDQRMREAVDELAHFREFDYLIVNDNFGVALAELKAVVTAATLRCSEQQARIESLLPELFGGTH